MKTGLQSVVAACAALFIPITAFSFATETSPPTNMKPLGAASFDLGSKHVVGYFLPTDGRCRLTLMIGEANGEAAPPAARLMFLVEGGGRARFDSESGESLSFACKTGAAAMSATRVATLAALEFEE